MAVATVGKQEMVEALIKALTGMNGPEWVSLHDIKTRLLNARVSLTLAQINTWLDHLIKEGKVQRKYNGHEYLYWLLNGENVPSCEIKPDRAPIQEDKPPRRRPKWNLLERQGYESEIAKLSRTISELESAIMAQEREETRALSIYGSENALEELTMQVSLSPKYRDLNPAECRYVAQTGLISGLNPEFHLHAWKNKKRVKGDDGKWRTEEVLTVTPDYKALIAATPDPIMTSDRRLTTDEMKARGIDESEIKDGSIAYEVTGTNLNHAIKARQAGIEYTPFKGFGWWSAKKDKDTYKDGKKTGTRRVPNDTPTGRDGEWVAKKRAIRDLFNQMADLRIKFGQVPGAQVNDDQWVFSGDVVEGELVDVASSAIKKVAAAWLTAEGITAAEKYMQEQGVVDDALNTKLGMDDWRNTPLTADEIKVVIDQIVVMRQMEAHITQDQREIIDGEIIEDKPGDDAPKASAEPAKCSNCNERNATGKGSHPALCGLCAKKESDKEAAKES